MKNTLLVQLILGTLLLAATAAHAQDAVVRIPLNSFDKPASDLKGSDGKILSIGELKSQFDKSADLSRLNPAENKFWQNTALSSNQAVDRNLHAQMPTPEEGLIYDNFVGAVRELGMYAINVRSAGNSEVYRLKSGLQVHASLLKAALLRKIGVYQESPKYYQSVKVRFKTLEEMNSFISQAFCVNGPDELAIGCLSIDPESRGFLSDKSESSLTLVVHGAYLEKMNAEVPNLFDGLTPSNENTISYYGQSRAYRALIVPYVIADVAESVNRFAPQSVFVRGGIAQMNYPFSADFNSYTTSDDVKWILSKMAAMTDADWNEVVEGASFPPQLKELVKVKLLHRFNNMVETFFSSSERKKMPKITLPSLAVNSGDGVVVNGKVMTETIPGYPQRFSHGERQSPFESRDFLKYVKIKAQSSVIETVLGALSNESQKTYQSASLKSLTFSPNGQVQPLFRADATQLGVNAMANRIITTGTFYGSQAAVQMVDSVTIGASAGYMHMEGLTAATDLLLGGGASYMRTFVHVRPITSLQNAASVPLKDLYVPSKLKKLTAPLKDGKLTEFLNSLEVGEVFTISDSIGAFGRIGVSTAINDLVLFSSAFKPTIGIAADATRVVMRQIQFVKTNDGLQVYIRNQHSNMFGLELNVDYFINLLKIRAQTTNLDINTKMYLVNFDAAFLSQVASGDASQNLDADAQTKVDAMKAFGNKAALALRALLTESSEDALDANFKNQKFEIDHELQAKETRIKFLWFKSNKLKEEHLLSLQKSQVPNEINGVTVVNQPIRVVTYKKGELYGKDGLNLGLEVSEALLKQRFKKNVPGLQIPGQNPSQIPFGKAEWTTIRTDSELTQTRPGALPSVAVIEHVWGGWSLKQKELKAILESANNETRGIADYPLVPQGALYQVAKVDFYRVTSHLSVLPNGLKTIKDLMLSATAKTSNRSQKLFTTLVQMYGYDDGSAYMKECLRHGNSRISFTWLQGTALDCVEPWVENIIGMAKKFPNDGKKSAEDNLRSQNKWMTDVLVQLNKNIPLANLVGFLGKANYIYYLEVTGFRAGDEDGDDGTYVSNVMGEPDKKHPYANGLISVLGDKSKINMTELEQTTGAGY